MKYLPLMTFLVRRFILLFLVFSFLIFTWSCARKGRPDGGPKDITPPVLLKATPDTFSTQVDVNTKKIELYFDEYVKLKDYMKNVIISPPIDPAPIFSPSGVAAKKVGIEFTSELQPQTTYTINFGQSIQDNNEGNPLSYFSYIFSTGDFIDSLSIQGKVNNLGERKMPKNIIAALYKIDSTYNDSLIYTQKPYYIAKLDSANQFSLEHLREGNYRLIAFNDEVPNTKLDPGKEKLAFHPEIVSAGSTDTYELNLFQLTPPYRAREVAQVGYGELAFYFEGKPEQVEIQSLEPTLSTAKVYHKPYADTATLYFNPSIDSIAEKRVRMKFAVKYLDRLDSIPPVVYETEKYNALKVFGRNLDYVPDKMYEIEANYPLDTLDKKFIAVTQDSLDLDFKIKRMSRNKFGLEFPISFDSKYKISLLPGAAQDYMQRSNDSLDFSFGVGSIRNYGNLKLNIQNVPSSPFWLKLMNQQDKEVTSVYGTATQHEFKHLKPGEYYFKIMVDQNANARYDTGDWFEQRQPEPIYLYPENINVRAYWDIEETWILGANTKSSETSTNKGAPDKKDLNALKNTKPKTLDRH